MCANGAWAEPDTCSVEPFITTLKYINAAWRRTKCSCPSGERNKSDSKLIVNQKSCGEQDARCRSRTALVALGGVASGGRRCRGNELLTDISLANLVSGSQ